MSTIDDIDFMVTTSTFEMPLEDGYIVETRLKLEKQAKQAIKADILEIINNVQTFEPYDDEYQFAELITAKLNEYFK